MAPTREGRKKIMMTGRQKMIAAMLDILYPPRCHACGDTVRAGAEIMLCRSCLSELTFIKSPLCPRCGKELDRVGHEDHFCTACLKLPPPFARARSFVHFKPPARTLLHRLKFHGDTGAAATLVKLIARRGEIRAKQEYDLIVPVPLHPSRLRKRGLNQALVLARLLFPAERLKITPAALVRLKNTIAQTDLDGAARRKNLRGAFAADPSIPLRGRRIILVDDVYTTGTTVTECAQTLKKAGAELVDIVTVARA